MIYTHVLNKGGIAVRSPPRPCNLRHGELWTKSEGHRRSWWVDIPGYGSTLSWAPVFAGWEPGGVEAVTSEGHGDEAGPDGEGDDPPDLLHHGDTPRCRFSM